MYTKYFIYAISFYFLLGCVSKEEQLEGTHKPNIVWIIVEDMSPDLACFGNELVKTPTLNSLSEHGTMYTNAFAAGAACSPSRTALATGYYQNSIGAHHMRYPEHLRPELPEGVIPIHTILKENGYQTANIKSKPGNQKTDWLFNYDPNTYDVERWDSLKTDAPFFARINLSLTHRGFTKDKINPIDPSIIKVPPYYPDHEVTRQDWALYYESIQVLDRQISKILEDLKANNLLENTIIFFFSDHGRPMTRGKNYLYDSGLKVPLIVSSYDEKLKGKHLVETSNPELVNLIDVNATTLSLANITSYQSQGISFLGATEIKPRKFVYASADRTGETYFKSRTVRSQNFRYIRNYNRDFSVNSGATAYRKANHPIYHLLNILDKRGELNEHQSKLLHPLEYEELYDLKSDPYELINLANKPKWVNKLSEMSGNLDNWLKDIDDKGLGEDPIEIVQAFEEYGKTGAINRHDNIAKLEQKVQSVVDSVSILKRP